MTPYEQIAAQMEAAKERMIRDYVRHVFECEDPIACEIRAWQEMFQDEEERRKTMN